MVTENEIRVQETVFQGERLSPTSAPGTDIEVISWHQQALRLVEYAATRIIKSQEDLKNANDDLTIIARIKKAMEERRQHYVRPLNDQVKAVNENYKLLMKPVEEAEKITKQKMLDYRSEQERIRREQEEINRKRIEAAEAEMRLKGELTEPVNLLEVIAEPSRRVSTELGTSGTIKVRKWKLVDISKVPPEFLLVDAGKITKLVKAGIGSIAGIEIYEEESIRVTTR